MKKMRTGKSMARRANARERGCDRDRDYRVVRRLEAAGATWVGATLWLRGEVVGRYDDHGSVDWVTR